MRITQKASQLIKAGLIYGFYRLLSSTWKIRTVEPSSLQSALKARTPATFAHWHGDELALLAIAKRYRICTLVSLSQDGALMALILRWMGGIAVRGSSSRRAAAGLIALIHKVKKGKLNASFAVDGPKGPRHKAKPGILKAHFELNSNLPIFTAGVACDRKWIFYRSWNQAYLPKPFAKIVVFWGEFKPECLTLSDHENLLNLEKTLHRSRESAEKILESQWI